MIEKVYDSPSIEIIEFQLEDSIATSGDPQGVAFIEEFWGGVE